MHEYFQFPIPQFYLGEVAFIHFLDEKMVRQVRVIGAEVGFTEDRPQWKYVVECCSSIQKELKQLPFLVCEQDLISRDFTKLTGEFTKPTKINKDEESN